MKRTRPWELSDAVWERMRPFIPERPAEDDRQMLSTILYVLRTSIQWNALPRELGACTTVYNRFRLWEKLDVTYKAFLQLACGLICFQHCDRFRSLQVFE
jgi:transposase